MAISAEQVKRLRDRTGAGMADCKKALEEANGDESQAIEVLRKKGAASAAKRADRVAKEGVIAAAVSSDKSRGAIAEINSETDFVARNDSFIEFAQSLVNAALETNPTSNDEWLNSKLSNGATIADEVGAQTGRLGEKLEARRVEVLNVPGGVVTSYIHPGAKLGVLVGISGGDKDKASAVGREIAMQIAAMNPLALNRSQVSMDQIEKELDVYRTQARNEGKKEDIIERISKNKLEKYYQDNCLLEQSFIKDAARTITDLLKDVGSDATITQFVRMQLGEQQYSGGTPVEAEAAA